VQTLKPQSMLEECRKKQTKDECAKTNGCAWLWPHGCFTQDMVNMSKSVAYQTSTFCSKSVPEDMCDDNKTCTVTKLACDGDQTCLGIKAPCEAVIVPLWISRTCDNHDSTFVPCLNAAAAGTAAGTDCEKAKAQWVCAQAHPCYKIKYSEQPKRFGKKSMKEFCNEGGMLSTNQLLKDCSMECELAQPDAVKNTNASKVVGATGTASVAHLAGATSFATVVMSWFLLVAWN